MINNASLVGDELLISVFAQFQTNSKFQIADETDIIKAFYKRRDKYPELYKNYAFDYDGIFPDSRTLSDAIDSIMQARMIGRMNVDLKDYFVFDAVKVRYEKFIKPSLDEVTERDIENLSKEIAEDLRVKQG